MTGTKRTSKSKSAGTAARKVKKEHEKWDKLITNELKEITVHMAYMHRTSLDAIDRMCFENLALLGPDITNKTPDDLKAEKYASNNSTAFFDTASILKNIDSALLTSTRKPQDDEGYLTAGESKRSASVDRQNRSRKLVQQPQYTIGKTRRSRSCSTTTKKTNKNVTIQMPPAKTPSERRWIAPSSGFITPKIKANAPISVLRRPKHGELAVSIDGSPLMVNSIATDICANVNIPLGDGRLISLQPSRGLRMSEIPDLDDETQKQLKTLRDNLSKVVNMFGSQ